jgi:hypothetical protein
MTSDAPTPALTICRWAEPQHAPFAAPVFMFDADGLPEDLTRVSVVLPRGNADRARELAARNAARVLLGDAAVRDSGIVAPLARELGEERLGLWLPVRRMAVSWSLDTESNADFRCITPSRVKPAWEILLSDGSATGTEAGWWTGQMLARGAGMVLIAAELTGDADLNICAELAEQFAGRLWLTPRTETAADLRPWVQYGHVRNLIIPAGPTYDEMALALATGPAPPLNTAAA